MSAAARVHNTGIEVININSLIYGLHSKTGMVERCLRGIRTEMQGKKDWDGIREGGGGGVRYRWIHRQLGG